MNEEKMECCGTCRWWNCEEVPAEVLSGGYCERFPPNVPVLEDGMYQTYSTGEVMVTQPITYAHERCGEWGERDGR